MDAAEFQREVGRRIRRKRQMLGWSQGALARQVTMPQSQLSRWERGDFRQMNLWQLARVIEALLTSPDFIFGTSDDPGEVPLPGCPAGEPSLDSVTLLPVAHPLQERVNDGEYTSPP